MSRDDGFQVADIDSSYLDDAKMRALWQRLRDPDRMARAVLLHESTFLASWRHGERVTVAEAAPVWLPVDDDLVDHLKAVRLLDRTGKVARESWSRWFDPAQKRRDERRESGRIGGLTKAANRAKHARNGPSDAVAELEQTPSSALPVRPSVPSVPTVNPTVNPTVQPPHTPRDGSLSHTTEAICEAWTDATGLTLLGSGSHAIGTVDDAARRHPEASVVRAIYTARASFDHIPQAAVLASAVRDALDPFQASKPKAAAGGHTRTAEEVEAAFTRG